MKSARLLGTGVITLVLILTLSTGEPAAAGKKFPTKPIQIVIPFQPGDTDIILRPFIEKMPEFLGQPMTMVYRPGAAGALGAKFAADSKPDGYTLLGTSQSSIVILPLTQKDLEYTWESFAPIVSLSEGPNAFAVQSNAPWKSVKELVADARQNPGKITYSSSGVYGISHLTGAAFCKVAGINLSYIPSQGSGPALTAALGGHVNIYSGAINPLMPHYRAGTMRVLAFFSDQRVPAIPEAPTFAEEGYPVIIRATYGLLAPKGTPREVTETVCQAAKKAYEKYGPSISDQITKQMGGFVAFREIAQYTDFLRGEHQYFDALLKEVRK